MVLRKIFPFFFLLLSSQADSFLAGCFVVMCSLLPGCLSPGGRGLGLSRGFGATGEGRKGNLKEWHVLQGHPGSLCLSDNENVTRLLCFLILWAHWNYFLTNRIWRELGKISCYAVCIWRWHMWNEKFSSRLLLQMRQKNILFRLVLFKKLMKFTGESTCLMWYQQYLK